jgi:hypothetical protein
MSDRSILESFFLKPMFKGSDSKASLQPSLKENSDLSLIVRTSRRAMRTETPQAMNLTSRLKCLQVLIAWNQIGYGVWLSRLINEFKQGQCRLPRDAFDVITVNMSVPIISSAMLLMIRNQMVEASSNWERTVLRNATASSSKKWFYIGSIQSSALSQLFGILSIEMNLVNFVTNFVKVPQVGHSFRFAPKFSARPMTSLKSDMTPDFGH